MLRSPHRRSAIRIRVLSVRRNEHSVEITAAASEIFPWLADSEGRCRWMGALVESEPLTDGPPVQGSRYHDVFEDHGQRIEIEAELVGVDEPRGLVVHLSATAFDATIRQSLEEVNGRTRVTAVIETTYTKLGARLLGSVATRYAQKQLEADLGRLKALVESGEEPPVP